MTRRTRASIAVPILVLIVAGGLRLVTLGQPARLYFDEQWYANDAYAYLGGAVPLVYPAPPPPVAIVVEQTWMHPPLGKWMMAAGQGPLGSTPFGWRFSSAVFGIAGVFLVYCLGMVLWKSPWWAGLAAFLLAVDGLHIVLSRIAMLDIFVTTFVSAGALLLALDRARPPPNPDGRVTRWFGSRYRLGAGLAFGAAVATKWSGGFALALAVILCLAGFLDRDRETPVGLATRLRTTLLCFALVPLVVYLVSYAQFFVEHGPNVQGFLTLQWRMLQFQLHDTRITSGTSNTSNPLTWPLLLHPVELSPSSITGYRILALGNPIVWWGFVLLLPVAVLAWLKTARHWTTGLILAFFAALYLPWLFVPRVQYLFYVAPAVPFMCLIAVAALRWLPARAGQITAKAYAAAAGLACLAFLPLWIGRSISVGWGRALYWLPGWR